MMQLGVVAHWSACLWALQATFAARLEGTWLLDKGYCTALADADDDSAEAAAERLLFSHKPPIETVGEYGCVSTGNVYSACLYFAVMTLTSIGYGDIAATPLNAAEQLIATSIMIVGGVAWAQFVVRVTDDEHLTHDPHPSHPVPPLA